MRALAVLAAAGVGAVACEAPAQGSTAFPDFSEPNLKAGRTVWMGTCRECHANSMSDAPQVKDTAQWEKRAAKGKAALYASAIRGLVTAQTEMPPRGGNAKLTDREVQGAVDYMIAITTRTRKTQ